MRVLSSYELDLVAGGYNPSDEIVVTGQLPPDDPPSNNDPDPDGSPPSGGGGGSHDHYNASDFITAATGADLVELERAIDYLAQSQKGRDLLDWAKANNITITIVHDNRDGNHWDATHREIFWDPLSALQLRDDSNHIINKYESAALGLAHEIGHIYYDMNGIGGFGPTSNSKWYSEDEKWIIENLDNVIAGQLGETERTNHWGDGYHETDSVTANGTAP